MRVAAPSPRRAAMPHRAHRSAPASCSRRPAMRSTRAATCALAARIRLQVMGGDQHRLAHPVQLHQQRQQPQRHLPVEVAGRLVREDHVGRHDHRARQRRALPFAARKLRRQRLGLRASPTQARSSSRLPASAPSRPHGQRQRHVLGHRQMVEELAVLMHHADAPAGAVRSRWKHDPGRRTGCAVFGLWPDVVPVARRGRDPGGGKHGCAPGASA
jgi:hypothetical protein